ncbi:MAG: helix-turn-helix transcriptional regulator [Proteobacteria bacterium]|nr:helix-turn-helix transcriptional regulator [Pseudomonadota bacterium]
MANTKVQIGRRIKELRKKAGLTQEGLAGLVTIDPHHLSRLERGIHYPSIDTLELIAQHLHVPLKEFFIFPEDETADMLRDRLVQSISIMDEAELRRAVTVIRPG